MTEEYRFWMVYVEGRNSPKVKHTSDDDARREAERLAIQEDKKVYILKALGYVEPLPPPTRYRGLDSKEEDTKGGDE